MFILALSLISSISILSACEKEATTNPYISQISKKHTTAEPKTIIYSDDTKEEVRLFAFSIINDSLLGGDSLTENQKKKLNDAITNTYIPEFENSGIEEEKIKNILVYLKDIKVEFGTVIKDVYNGNIKKESLETLSSIYRKLVSEIGISRISKLLLNMISANFQYNADECRRKYETYGDAYQYQLKNEAIFREKKKCLIENIGESNMERIIRIIAVLIERESDDKDSSISDQYQILNGMVSQMENLTLNTEGWDLVLEIISSFIKKNDSILSKTISIILDDDMTPSKMNETTSLLSMIIRDLTKEEASKLLSKEYGVLLDHMDDERIERLTDILTDIDKISLENIIKENDLAGEYALYKEEMTVGNKIYATNGKMNLEGFIEYLNYKNPALAFIIDKTV